MKKGIQSNHSEQRTDHSVEVKTAKEQEDNPLIGSKDILIKGGFFRGSEKILTEMLKSHLQGGELHPYGKGIAGLARFIAATGLFYKKVNGEYTPLKTSTITTYLRNIKSTVLAEIAKEKAEKERLRNERRRRK